jgi:hypothetical protein
MDALVGLVSFFFGDTNGSVWLYDNRRHPVSAAHVVRHRVCADTFMHILTCLSALTLCVWSVVNYVLLGVWGDYLLTLAVLGGVTFALVAFAGEWAMRNGRGMLCYAYLALTYCIWVAMLWTAAVGVVSIPQGQVREGGRPAAARHGGAATPRRRWM